MTENEAWRLTLDLRDVTKKKEVQRYLDFDSLEAAEAQVKKFRESRDNDSTKVFRMTNEDGEYIEFRGCDWARHSVKKVLAGIF